ncbi:MAG TPA: response regulator [Planctomycetaceae bacterium]|nr:response regulator [Planctomycetaceae bacterium]
MTPEENRPEAERQDRLRVLVLDDEPIVGQRLRQALAKHNFDLEIFDDPAQALVRLGQRHFDVVVTDLRMEGTDGIGILEYVNAHCPDTRVILITGYATVEVAREALVKGAFDFIAKPFKPNDLRQVIHKAALSLGRSGIG